MWHVEKIPDLSPEGEGAKGCTFERYTTYTLDLMALICFHLLQNHSQKSAGTQSGYKPFNDNT
ncbi:hypothetical protein HMPREF3182_00857 [Megasphaera hutchinsoni]|uniref:Uncharacterized protein n=1 Tax=Megasphaera hutchinsoni TaxID=1588748 RepID=A0A134CFR6_9FIRM|nr:hypothetical protein HMPREF3182_00857 [Megasphaera hutchinsoni]